MTPHCAKVEDFGEGWKILQLSGRFSVLLKNLPVEVKDVMKTAADTKRLLKNNDSSTTG